MIQHPHQKPRWLKKRLPTGPEYERVKELIGKDRLHTVCQEAKCPNMWECFSQHTATFLIMIAGFVQSYKDLLNRLIRPSRNGLQPLPDKWVSVMS
jgi:hypothetical protein